MKNRELEGSERSAGHPSIPEPSKGLLELCLLVKVDYLALKMSTSTGFSTSEGQRSRYVSSALSRLNFASKSQKG